MNEDKDFEKFYLQEDPWGVNKKQIRNYVFKKIFKKYFFKNMKLVEIGCGEGNFSVIINEISKNNLGVDISLSAINRAKKLNLSNYKFEQSNLIDIDYSKFNMIICIEVLYYLSDEEIKKFFEKIKGTKRLIFSAPIIGSNIHREYYTDNKIKKIFENYNYKLIEEKKLNFNGAKSVLHRIFNKIFFNNFLSENIISYSILQILPLKYIYQKAYVLDLK